MVSAPVSGSLRIRWMMAFEFGLSRSRLRSRNVTCAVEADSVRSRSASTSTSFADRGDQPGWSGARPSTLPWASEITASAARSRWASEIASALPAKSVAMPL